MNRWYDKAVDELEKAYDDGEITRQEFDDELRELNRELRMQAEEAAAEAYDSHMGSW